MSNQPATQKEAINQLWNEVIGSNGDGLREIARKNRDDISDMKEDVAFIKGRVDGHMETAKPSQKTITRRRLMEVGVVALVFGGLAFLGIMLGFKLLSPEDIIEMLAAWKGVA
jgi:hypothetical protein